MRIAILLLLVVLFQAKAELTHAQSVKISLDLKNVTVEKALSAIEESSGYSFLYNSKLIDVDRYVSVKAKDKAVDDILDEIFTGTDVQHKLSDKQIILSVNESTATKATQPSGQKLTGKVVDKNGEALPGVTILIVGSTRGVFTDENGNFEIDKITNGTKLSVSLLGMQTKEFVYQGKNDLVIVLEEKANELDEVTIVAFSKQKKESVVSSITTIKPSELKVPSSNLTTAFAGRVAGLISYQRSGEPGLDNAEFFIRGVTTFGTGKSNPLILIDNVEMTTEDLSRLTVDDISAFSIMKDANATALYGARGANGVILVTTKEGKEGKLNVQFRIEGSHSAPTETLDYVDPVNYMRYRNEAVRTRNPILPLPYSASKIAYTERGEDPMRYPANNWQDMLFNDHTFNQRYNLNVSGGGKVARYFISAAYSRDNGIIKMDKRNDFNNNIQINRYTLRSNVNVNLTKTTEVIVRLSGAFDDYNGPIDSGSDLFTKALNADPVLFAPYYKADESTQYFKHILFGNSGTGEYMNPYADMVKGYKDQDRSTLTAQFELKQDLEFIAEGLTARGLFNVNRYSLLGQVNSYKPFYYSLQPELYPGDYRLSALNPNSGTNFLESSGAFKTVEIGMYAEGALQYNRKFAEKHDIGVLLVATLRENKDGDMASLQRSLPHRNLGLAGKLSYGYSDRYFLEANFGYNGSERFGEKERWGFFPSAGAGWIVSNESFMESTRDLISKLKLKATYGLVGNDDIGGDRFFYISNVNLNDPNRAMTFGEQWSYTRNGVSVSRYPDPTITWEISKKMNLGFELNLLKNIEIQADYFTEKRSRILQRRSDIPTSMGLQATPSSNIGKADGSGFEISVDYNKSFSKDLWATFRGNFTYASSKYMVYEEPDYATAPWRSHQNRKISQQYGYIAERLFLDDDDVRNSPQQQFGEYGAGDIKYRDINGDMVINENDQVPIGFPVTPEIIYGFGVSAGYKNFDLSAFFQGSDRSSFWIDPAATAPFINNRVMLQYWADDYWNESSRNVNALWPRLSNYEIKNNTVRSTWFMRNGAFLRLKTAELGYSIPSRFLKPAKLEKARVYLSGTNLFLLSKFKLWDVEMAGNGLKYPLQRVINIGLNVNF